MNQLSGDSVVARYMRRRARSRQECANSYCPFDRLDDVRVLGFESIQLETSYGKISVQVRNLSDQPTVVLLHGVGGSWRSWEPMLAAARQADLLNGSLVAFDLPGFGASDNQLGTLDIEQVGSQIVSALERLEVSRAVLVGHSMGGFLALDMASRGHAIIKSVVAVSGAYASVVATARDPWGSIRANPSAGLSYLQLQAMAAAGPIAVLGARIVANRRWTPFFLGRTAAHPWCLPPKIEHALAASLQPTSFRYAAANGRHYDLKDRWMKISVPVEALFGATDQLVPPSDSMVLSAANPSTTTTVINDAGHYAHFERPFAVIDAIERGLRHAW